MTLLYAYVATLALTTNDSYRSNGSTKFCSMHTFNFGTDRFPHDEYDLCCCSYRGDNCVICVVDISTFVLDLRTAVLCCCAGTVFVLVGCWMGNRIRLCVFLILFTKTPLYLIFMTWWRVSINNNQRRCNFVVVTTMKNLAHCDTVSTEPWSGHSLSYYLNSLNPSEDHCYWSHEGDRCWETMLGQLPFNPKLRGYP